MSHRRWVTRSVEWGMELIFYAFAILLALFAGGLVMAAAGVSPLEAYGLIWQGAAGSVNSIKETLVKATPLLFAGLSYSFAYRSGLFNIGAEGQIYIGALTGAMAALLMPADTPFLLHLPLSLLCGCLGGAIWGSIAGLLKVGRGASEIINTIMLNYIAIYLISYMVTGPLKDPNGSMPQSAPFRIARFCRHCSGPGCTMVLSSPLSLRFLCISCSTGRPGAMRYAPQDLTGRRPQSWGCR